jgi:hypothetical protein
MKWGQVNELKWKVMRCLQMRDPERPGSAYCIPKPTCGSKLWATTSLSVEPPGTTEQKTCRPSNANSTCFNNRGCRLSLGRDRGILGIERPLLSGSRLPRSRTPVRPTKSNCIQEPWGTAHRRLFCEGMLNDIDCRWK